MSPALNMLGLVLTSSTSFAMASLGYLPVTQLRQHGTEFFKLVCAWIVVMALSPQAIFHWYLILAILCFVAWTKRDHLGGKLFLAIAAALGLSVGVIFPLEASPVLGVETRSGLASLYLGGFLAGLAYVASVCLRARPQTHALKSSVWLIILAMIWCGLLEEGARRGWYSHPSPSMNYTEDSTAPFESRDLLPAIGPILVLLLAIATAVAALRKSRVAAWFSLATSLAAFAANFVMQGIIR